MKLFYSTLIKHTPLKIWAIASLILMLLSSISLKADSPKNPGPKSDTPPNLISKNDPRRAIKQKASLSHLPISSFSKTKKIDNDPIRFQLSSSKNRIAPGEEVELIIIATLLDIPSTLLFTFEGSNAFRLKLLLPDGFVSTGGNYVDLIGQELTKAKPTVQYKLKGYFTKTGSSNDFRLLRSNGQADQRSLFVEKARLTLSVLAYDQIVSHSSARNQTSGCNLTLVRVYPRTDCSVCVGRTEGAQIQVSTVGKQGPWQTVLTIPNGEIAGWREFAISGATDSYKAIQYVSPTAANCNVAELEFYSGTTKLTGTVFADAGGPHQGNTAVNSEKAFDGNTSTYYDALNPTGGYVGLELTNCLSSSTLELQLREMVSNGSGGLMAGQVLATVTNNGIIPSSLLTGKTVNLFSQVTGNHNDVTMRATLPNGTSNMGWGPEGVGSQTSGLYGWQGAGGSYNFTTGSYQMLTYARLNGTVIAGSSTQPISFTVSNSSTPTLSISPSGTQTVGSSSGSMPLNITVSNTNWAASSNSTSWLTVNSPGGSSSGSVMLNYTANTTGSSRTGIVTVTGSGIIQTITITQSSENAISNCTPFADVCSGNLSEIRYKTITVTTAGTYTLSVHYKAPEKQVMGIVLIDGTSQTVSYAQTATYLDKTVGTIVLTQGTHTIGLSSGADGGIICFDNICLAAGSGGNCVFTPTVNPSNSTPSCGTAINLSAICTGADCSGVSYNWGTGQSGPTISVTVPSSNGTYSYTVTASKSNCSNVSAQTTINVTNCSPTDISNLRLAIPEMAFDMQNPLTDGSGSYFTDANKQFGVLSYTQDGGGDHRDPILPWMKEIRDGATALNGRTMGGHGWATWTSIKPKPAGQFGGNTWQRGNINPYWVNQIKNQLTYCQQNNLKLGVLFVPTREYNADPAFDKMAGFLVDNDCQYARSPNGTTSVTNSGERVMHMEYAATALANLNDNSNPAVRMYWDFYDAISEIKSFHQAGVLTYAALGMRGTHEIGYDVNGGSPQIFGDYHEMAHEGLRSWLKNKLSGSNDAQKLQTLNQRWNTSYTDWSQVQITYETSNPLQYSFNNTPRGREILAYRTKVVADMMCLMAKAWWTQCPTIHMVLDIGQIFGSQAMATGTCDIGYLLDRLNSFRSSMGSQVTGKIIVKLNGAAWDDLSFHATALRQICQQKLGYSFIITELDYGSNHWNGTNIEGRPLNDVVDNIYKFQRYAGGNASITFLAGNAWQATGGGKAVAQAYLQKTDRATAPYQFCYDNSCSTNVLNTSVIPMLSEGYNLRGEMQTPPFNYLIQDVRINFQSLTEYN